MTSGKDDTPAEDGDVLSPEELDISDDEHVAEIDDGRYVVSPNEPIEDVPGHVAGGSEQESPAVTGEPGPVPDRRPDPELGHGRADQSEPVPGRNGDLDAVSEADVRRWLTAQFDESNSRYGFDVTATFDGSVQQRQMVSNDVVTIFESLVLWYAQQIDSTTPVEEVLGILLMEANVPIRYPSASLQRTLESTDLAPDDPIADLVEAVGDEGFRI